MLVAHPLVTFEDPPVMAPASTARRLFSLSGSSWPVGQVRSRLTSQPGPGRWDVTSSMASEAADPA